MGMKHMEHMNTMAPRAARAGREGPAAGRDDPEAAVDPKLFPPLIDYMVKQGVYVNPTLVTSGGPAAPSAGAIRWRQAQQLVKDPNLAFVPADDQGDVDPRARAAPVAGSYANIAEFLKQVLRGRRESRRRRPTPDAARIVPGSAVHYEMQMLADCGIPPMKILQGATLWNAEMIKKEEGSRQHRARKVGGLYDHRRGSPGGYQRDNERADGHQGRGSGGYEREDPKWVNPILFCAACHKGWSGQQELVGR